MALDDAWQAPIPSAVAAAVCRGRGRPSALSSCNTIEMGARQGSCVNFKPQSSSGRSSV